MIEVRGVAKYFGRFSALRDLNLNVASGEFVALFGRNGAGKTTLLRIVAGLTRPSSGTVRIHAASDQSPVAARGLIGYLSHNTALYGDLTAVENLQFYARLLGLPCSRADLEFQIERVGLSGRGDEAVRNYSRGMQQRLAIARAFLHDPVILLLDEPFTGLDQTGTEFLKGFLRQEHARGKTCLMATHDASSGHELADRLVVVENGVVALDISRRSLSLEEFQSRYRALAGEQGHAF
jgi:heme exporter protein A